MARLHAPLVPSLSHPHKAPYLSQITTKQPTAAAVVVFLFVDHIKRVFRLVAVINDIN